MIQCAECSSTFDLVAVGLGKFDLYSMTCALCIRHNRPKCFADNDFRLENKDRLCAVCLFSNACVEKIKMQRAETQVLTNEQAHAIRKILRKNVIRDQRVIARERPFPRAGYAQVIFDLCRRVHGSGREERFNICGMNKIALQRLERDIRLQVRDGWEWDVVDDEQYRGQIRVYNVRKMVNE